MKTKHIFKFALFFLFSFTPVLSQKPKPFHVFDKPYRWIISLRNAFFSGDTLECKEALDSLAKYKDELPKYRSLSTYEYISLVLNKSKINDSIYYEKIKEIMQLAYKERNYSILEDIIVRELKKGNEEFIKEYIKLGKAIDKACAEGNRFNLFLIPYKKLYEMKAYYLLSEYKFDFKKASSYRKKADSLSIVLFGKIIYK